MRPRHSPPRKVPMHAAVRPYATAGVALVGAGVIAVTPVPAPLGDAHIPTLRAAVALTQATNPYEEVFQTAAANVQTIFNTFLANPTPILSQILSNQNTALQALLASGGAVTIPSLSQIQTALTSQSDASQSLVAAIQLAGQQIGTAFTTGLDGLPPVPQIVQTALADLTSGNVEGAINNVLLAAFTTVFPLVGVKAPGAEVPGILAPALGVIAAPLQNLVNAIDLFGPIGEVLANPLQNLVNVLKIPTTSAGSLALNFVVSGLLAPLFATPAAFGTAIQGVINAIGGGNPTNVLTAIADAPAVFLGGLFNGEVDGTPIGPNVGNLTNVLIGFPPGSTLFGGYLGGLLNQFSLLFGSSNPAPGTLLSAFLPGLVPALQSLQTTIAGALTPPAIPAAAAAPLQLTTAAANTPSAVPNAAAKTVTVTTAAPVTASAPAVTTPTAGTVTANTAKTVNTGAAGAAAATAAPIAAGASAGSAAKVTTGTVTATTASTTGITTGITSGATGLTGGNKATPGNGTKTAGGAAGSTVSKIAAGLGGSGQAPKHGK